MIIIIIIMLHLGHLNTFLDVQIFMLGFLMLSASYRAIYFDDHNRTRLGRSGRLLSSLRLNLSQGDLDCSAYDHICMVFYTLTILLGMQCSGCMGLPNQRKNERNRKSSLPLLFDFVGFCEFEYLFLETRPDRQSKQIQTIAK